jgi:hypothetical protein
MGFLDLFKQKKNAVPQTVTLESLRLAARANNSAGGNNAKRKNLIMLLEQHTQSLTKQDVGKWRTAWQMAINIENPRRANLYDIYTDTMIDLHLTGCISQRKGKTLLKSFVIKNSDGTEDDEAVKIFESEWFYNFVSLALDSRFWGHSLIQLGDIITDEKGLRKFANVELVPRKHVIPEYGVFVREQGDSWEQGIDYRQGSISDWCVEVGESHDLGLLLKCAPHSLSKKNMTTYWDVFGEIFGMPMRIGKTNSQDPSDRQLLEDVLANMGAAGWGLFPDGTDIEIKESTRGDAYNVYDKRIDRANSEISKGILNQTMTIDSGSSLSQSETHLEVFENVCAADARLIKYIVNDRLIPKMIRHGFDLKGKSFDWDEASTYTPAEQREFERMLLQYFDIDPQYFIDKYKIDIVGIKESAGGFFE